MYPGATNPQTYWTDFALCFECHNRYEVMGLTFGGTDVSHSNFWNDDATPQNSHYIHLSIYTSHFDSDWNGVADSAESCIACHNVHGPANQAMIRHGELISTPGTTDKVPALNFAYLTEKTTGPWATATWTPTIPSPGGDYYVYARWPAGTNRATNSSYTINYNGGSTTVQVNQQINGGQWNLLVLGKLSFASGTVGNIVLTNQGADGCVIADAIGLDSDGVFAVDPEIVVDNDDPAVQYVGTWGAFSTDPGTYGANMRFNCEAVAPDPTSDLQDSLGGNMGMAGPGIVQNGVCNACHWGISYRRAPYLGPRAKSKVNPNTVAPDGVSQVLFTALVLDPDDNIDSVAIDLSPIDGSSSQAMYDDGTNGDVAAGDHVYSFKATVPSSVSSGIKTLSVTAVDDDSLTAQSKTKLSVLRPGEIIMDNPDAVYVCTWSTFAGDPGTFGDDLRFRLAGTGSCTATWTPDIDLAGSYKVYAWWAAGTNRATNAKYTIHYDGGSTTVQVNQQINGGQWNLLGTFPFLAGTSGSVVLSDDANGVVIADAIFLDLQ